MANMSESSSTSANMLQGSSTSKRLNLQCASGIWRSFTSDWIDNRQIGEVEKIFLFLLQFRSVSAKGQKRQFRNKICSKVLMEADDFGIVTHFCVIESATWSATWTIWATFWWSSFPASWHGGSTTGWEISRRKQFTPQGSIIRARRWPAGPRCISRGFTWTQTNNCRRRRRRKWKMKEKLIPPDDFSCHRGQFSFVLSKTFCG